MQLITRGEIFDRVSNGGILIVLDAAGRGILGDLRGADDVAKDDDRKDVCKLLDELFIEHCIRRLYISSYLLESAISVGVSPSLF